jgi:hypothetical protein
MDGFDAEELLSERISGNPSFDRSLIERYLHAWARRESAEGKRQPAASK